MRFDHAYGAVLGAFVGDAAGAVLEFGGKPNLELVRLNLLREGSQAECRA